MAEFSATDVAIEGVRLAARKPAAVAVWSLAQLLFALVSGVVFVLLVGPDLLAMTRPEVAADLADPAKALSMFAGTLRVDGLSLLLFLPWGAVMTCAVYRSLLRPQDRGFFYLKLGADELRMMALGLIFTAMAVAALFLLMFVAVFLAVVIGMGLGMLSRSGDASTGGALAVLIALLLTLLVFSWLAVRLSLAAPLTFAQGRLNLFGSWKLTRGHFWTLAGAYSLTAILVFILFMIGYPLSLVVAHLLTGEGIVPLYQMLTRPDFGSLSGYFSAPHLVLFGLQALYAGLTAAMIHAPAAAAYQLLAGSSVPGAAPQPAREPTGPWG